MIPEVPSKRPLRKSQTSKEGLQQEQHPAVPKTRPIRKCTTELINDLVENTNNQLNDLEKLISHKGSHHLNHNTGGSIGEDGSNSEKSLKSRSPEKPQRPSNKGTSNNIEPIQPTIPKRPTRNKDGSVDKNEHSSLADSYTMASPPKTDDHNEVVKEVENETPKSSADNLNDTVSLNESKGEPKQEVDEADNLMQLVETEANDSEESANENHQHTDDEAPKQDTQSPYMHEIESNTHSNTSSKGSVVSKESSKHDKNENESNIATGEQLSTMISNQSDTITSPRTNSNEMGNILESTKSSNHPASSEEKFETESNEHLLNRPSPEPLVKINSGESEKKSPGSEELPKDNQLITDRERSVDSENNSLSKIPTNRPQKKAPPPVPKKPSSKIAAFHEMLQKQQSQDLRKVMNIHDNDAETASDDNNGGNAYSGSEDVNLTKCERNSNSPITQGKPKKDFVNNLNNLFALPGMALPGSLPPTIMNRSNHINSSNNTNAHKETNMNEPNENAKTEIKTDVRQRRVRRPRGKLPSKISQSTKIVDTSNVNSVRIFKAWTIHFGSHSSQNVTNDDKTNDDKTNDIDSQSNNIKSSIDLNETSEEVTSVKDTIQPPVEKAVETEKEQEPQPTEPLQPYLESVTNSPDESSENVIRVNVVDHTDESVIDVKEKTPEKMIQVSAVPQTVTQDDLSEKEPIKEQDDNEKVQPSQEPVESTGGDGMEHEDDEPLRGKEETD